MQGRPEDCIFLNDFSDFSFRRANSFERIKHSIIISSGNTERPDEFADVEQNSLGEHGVSGEEVDLFGLGDRSSKSELLDEENDQKDQGEHGQRALEAREGEFLPEGAALVEHHSFCGEGLLEGVQIVGGLKLWVELVQRVLVKRDEGLEEVIRSGSEGLLEEFLGAIDAELDPFAVLLAVRGSVEFGDALGEVKRHLSREDFSFALENADLLHEAVPGDAARHPPSLANAVDRTLAERKPSSFHQSHTPEEVDREADREDSQQDELGQPRFLVPLGLAG